MDSNSSFSACSAVSNQDITSLTLSSITFLSSSPMASLNFSSDLVLHVVSVALEAVLGVDALLGLSVLISELLSLTDHALNVLLAQAALVVGDGNVGLLAGGRLVLSGHVEHTVGVNVEGDLNLGHATRSRGDPSKLELAQQVVVLGAGALALVHLDQHTRLVVSVGGEGLRLLGWDGGVTGNEGGHD